MRVHQLQKIFDVLAVSLSALCLFHCLALPLIVLSLPLLPLDVVQDESFHLWILGLAIPSSAIALFSSHQHKSKTSVLFLAGIGLLLMVLAVTVGENLMGESGETILTSVGGVILAFAHIRNFLMCRRLHCCAP